MIGWIAFVTIAILTVIVQCSYFPLEFWRAMQRHDITSGRRELYLSCTNDRMCDLVELEKLIELRKGKVKLLTAKIWERKGHCDHLIHHPEEYKQNLSSFISDVQNSTE